MFRRPLPPGYSKADLHIHTTYSDGTLEPEALLNHYAVFPDLRVVAVTDHDTIDGARRVAEHRRQHLDLFEHIEVVIGEEISTREGHVIGLFLDEWIPPELSAAETINRIHAQGGLAIAAHPYTHLLAFTGLRGVGDLIRSLPFDAVETRNSNFTELYANIWAGIRSRGMAQVGSSDAHFMGALGACYTRFPGETAADLRRAIAEHTTQAGGRCYGPLTLASYVVEQMRAGKSIIPNRTRSHHDVHGGDIVIDMIVDLERGAMRLICRGVLDARTASVVKRRVLDLANAGTHVVLDLAGIELLDSSGITALISGYKAASRAGTAYVICGASSIAAAALRMAHLDRVFDIALNAAEADRRLEAIAAAADMRISSDAGRRAA